MALIKLNKNNTKAVKGTNSYPQRVEKAEKDLRFLKRTNTIVLAIVGAIGIATAIGFITVLITYFEYVTTSFKEYKDALQSYKSIEERVLQLENAKEATQPAGQGN